MNSDILSSAQLEWGVSGHTADILRGLEPYDEHHVLYYVLIASLSRADYHPQHHQHTALLHTGQLVRHVG
jgi:hypothetical protein